MKTWQLFLILSTIWTASGKPDAVIWSILWYAAALIAFIFYEKSAQTKEGPT